MGERKREEIKKEGYCKTQFANGMVIQNLRFDLKIGGNEGEKIRLLTQLVRLI